MRYMARLLDLTRKTVLSLLRIRSRGACMIVFDEEGRVVLVRLTYGSPSWKLPGGGVKHSETFREAALREAREEIGVSLTPSSEVALHGLFLKTYRRWHDDVAVFVATSCDVAPTESWEISAVERFDPQDLPADVDPATRRRIEEWLTGGDVPDRW